jgi:hypothetical protein
VYHNIAGDLAFKVTIVQNIVYEWSLKDVALIEEKILLINAPLPFIRSDKARWLIPV